MNEKAFVKVDKATFFDFVSRHDDLRFEYEDGYIVQQMTGGTLAHHQIAKRLARLIEAQVDQGNWNVIEARGVETAATIRYPDVVVEPIGAPSTSLATLEPALVAEVLSPSSIARDLQRKPAEYTAIHTLQAYIVASQHEAAVLVWLRQPDGSVPPEPIEINDRIVVPALALDLELTDIYRGIDLAPKDPE